MPYDRPIVGATSVLAERPDAGDLPPAPRRSGRDLLTPAAIALTLVPLLVTAVHMLRSDLHLIGDLATTELLTRDVGVHTPSIGPYSRDGWHHPGPALFYALALPYRLLGGTAPRSPSGPCSSTPCRFAPWASSRGGAAGPA